MPFPVKLDENLGTRGQLLLKESGFDVATVNDQNLTSAPDRQLIHVCAEEQRCLVTLDLDFSNPILFPPQNYSGIVVIRCPSSNLHQHILISLKSLTKATRNMGSLAGKLWIISGIQIREYAPVDVD